MRKCLAAGLAACWVMMGLLACGPGGGNGADAPNAPEGTPGAPRGAGPVAPAQKEQPLMPTIGVQPVPDTPVASLPAHADHEPIAQPPLPPGSLPKTEAPAALARFTREWVVSPKGNDSAAGTQAAPFRTIGKAISVVGPGELIRVLGGTYAEPVVIDATVKAGTASAPITLQGEGKPRIVPGDGTFALIKVSRPHWVIDGFEVDVQGKQFFALAFSGNVEGSMIANSELHHGSLGGGITTHGQANGAVIENNHIHNFVRTSGNHDSHGVVVQPTSKNIVVRNNDIHDNSGDSVQCLGPEGFSKLPPADGLVIENNHFYGNRENAVDVKTCFNVVIRNNRMHGFKPTHTAKGDAVVVHYSAKNVLIEGNEVYDSGKGISIGGNHEGPVPTGIVIRRNRVHDITTENGGEGSGIRLENSNGTVVVHNTITRVGGTALLLGHGTGGATTNLTLKNNILDGQVALSLGSERPGLKMGANLFSQGAGFESGGQPVELSTVQQATGDTSSVAADTTLAMPAFVPGANAVDKGTDAGLPFCGPAPDIGAVETGC